MGLYGISALGSKLLNGNYIGDYLAESSRVIKGNTRISDYSSCQLSLDTTICQHANHMGGCQNYGPFLDPYYNTRLNI